jgi:hypothetical protein
MGQSRVIATFNNGTQECVVQFYGDEISFESDEFVGLTKAQASKLFQKRDVAYLQS